LIISYLATFLGTDNLSVLMCRKEVNQSINFVFCLSGNVDQKQRFVDTRRFSCSQLSLIT